jgi:hypothetical protein
MVTKPVLQRSAFMSDGLIRLRDMPLAVLSVEGFENGGFCQEYSRCNMTGLRLQVLPFSDN